MSGDDGVLVLTTHEKSWWLSMQEVVPALERVWTNIGRYEGENVRFICGPLPAEADLGLPDSVSRLKGIVITAVTPWTVRTALFLRRQLNVTAPMVVYVFGDSTEGFHAFGPLSDFLTERDTFVVSSEAEAAATRCSFPNAQVRVVPIPLVDQFTVSDGDHHARLDTPRLAYVGRVSEQKNLHTLLFALWISSASGRAPGVTLDVYGGEDNLGSPNMGLTYPNYATYLQDLTDLLGLGRTVTWHGLKPRDWLFDHVHVEPHILVSPTLHSDENFGSSVLASLVNGHQVVATAWGGHLGFQEWFPRQLTLVPVHRSTMGPVVDPLSLANAIHSATIRMGEMTVDAAVLQRALTEFSERGVARRSYEILDRTTGGSLPLERSSIQHEIDERRSLFGGTRKIYTGYEDPIAQGFFEIYGMRERISFDENADYTLAPWVSCSDDVLRIDDPHRGSRSFRLDPRVAEPVDVALCPSMDVCRLPQSLVSDLVAQGYAFPLPPALSAKAAEISGAAFRGTA
ncbi:glycosyltransferase [Nonomuraea glycinis]|uniref:glycosyltransferase n=1 Tax=Nonomuraea glycinis TaxID=2047744 RepID=UPI0033A663D2